LAFLLPTITDDLKQMLSLIITVLRRAHLLPTQPFPEL